MPALKHLDDPRGAFDRSDINELLTYREGQCFDRKRRKDPKEIAQWLVGFANDPRGGLLLLGVEDNGTVFGLHAAYNGGDYRNKIEESRGHVTHVMPHVRFLPVTTSNGKSDEVCVIYVPHSAQQVATTSDDDVYLRVGDQNKRLKHDEVTQLKQERGDHGIPFINLPSSQPFAGAQFHDGVLNDYLQRVGHNKSGGDLARLLVNRQLAVETAGEIRLTKAGLLLLTQDPRGEIPGASVRVLKYEGRTKLYGAQNNIVQDQTFYGPIPVVAQRVQDYVRSQLRQFRYLGADNRFMTIPELPEEAWFEVIVNALVHRAYWLVNESISVVLFDDRMEVFSPGDYPTGVDPAQFANSIVSRPRNRTIMDFMRTIEYVRMEHEGTLRIFGEMQKANLPAPEYSPPGRGQVHVVLRNDIDRRKAAQVGADTSAPMFNMFRLELQPIRLPEGIDPGDPPTFNEIRNGIARALTTNGWAVSSFTHDVAIDVSKPPLSRQGSEWVSMHDAFRFNVQEFNGRFFLALDFKIEVRSRANLKKIMDTVPHMLHQRYGRGFARINGQRVAGSIIRLDSATETVLFESRTARRDDPKTRTTVPFADVIPELTSTQLSELLASTGSKFDLYRERTRLSNVPPGIRLERIRAINAELVNRVFPVKIGKYQVFLGGETVRASQPEFAVNSFLREPAISFGSQRLSQDISKGLTSFGAYEKPDADIPIILMAHPSQMSAMEGLVAALQKGSKRYAGFHATFGANIKVVSKHAVSFEQYLSTCQAIVPSLSRDPLPLMLIFMPDERGLWSRANHQSPYYQVKHYLLENGIPSQGVDQETLANLEWKDLNLALDIFAKTGHVPWVLDEGLPLADVFIGLSYSSMRIKDNLERVVAYVCVFDEFGRWQYYIGNTEPVPFEERDIRLAGLIGNAVQRYAERSSVNHVHLHHGHKLKHETRSRVAEAVRKVASNANVHFLHINDNNPVRLFGSETEQEAQVSRGTYIRVSNDKQFFLATTGKSDLQSGYRGTPIVARCTPYYYGVGPNPDSTVYAQHVLSLTRLNWASTRAFSAEPITLLYSAKVARYMNIFVQNYGSFSLHPDLIRTPWFL